LIFFRQLVELPAKNQPLLDYFWDISKDWEILQRATTLHGRLGSTMWYKNSALFSKKCSQCSFLSI